MREYTNRLLAPRDFAPVHSAARANSGNLPFAPGFLFLFAGVVAGR